MITYAVSDTKYLIQLTYELLKDLKCHCDSQGKDVNEVYNDVQQTCKAISLSRYEKPKIFTKGYYKIVEQVENRFSPLQLQLLQLIWVK